MGLLSSLFGGNKPAESQQAKKNRKNFEILKYDGIRARSMHQLAYAIKCFEQAIAIDEDPETLQYLAHAYAESGRTDDAHSTLNRLIELTPNNIQALLALAQICFTQEDYEGMSDACRKAIACDEKNTAAYYLAAKAAHGQKNDLEAIVMLTKSIACDEKNIAALLLRAEVLWEMGQAKEAMEDIEKILELNADDEDALLLKAQIQSAIGGTEEALALLDHIAQLNPFNEKTYLTKGELLCKLKKLDEAYEVYEEAIELMPQNARFYQERGRVRLLKGDKEGSIADMKKAIELNPESETQISGNFDNFGKQSTTSIY